MCLLRGTDLSLNNNQLIFLLQIASLSLQRTGFGSRSVNENSVLDKLVMGQAFLRVRLSSPVCITPRNDS